MSLRENPQHLPYNPDLVPRAKELRKNMTPAERKFWNKYLRTFPHRVHRQRPINHYIVDFYCPKLKLIIEVDGDNHFTPEAQEYDQKRTETLQGYNLKIIRFTNQEIMNHFEEVCAIMQRYLDPP